MSDSIFNFLLGVYVLLQNPTCFQSLLGKSPFENLIYSNDLEKFKAELLTETKKY